MSNKVDILGGIDKRLYDTIYAEAAGGTDEEVNAVASVFLNRVMKEGYDKALGGSSAYRKKSKQYVKAQRNEFNPYEQKVYSRYNSLIDNLIQNRDQIQPYYFMENVNEYGEPPWVSDTSSHKDIGRQRFYTKKEK